MKFRKVIAMLMSAALCVGILAGCGGQGGSNDTQTPDNSGDTTSQGDTATDGDVDFSKKVNLVWAISGAGGMGTAVANQNAIDMIAERSGGAITIDLSTDGALGNEASLLQQTMEGSCDICGAAIGVVSQYSDYLAVFQMPFLVNNYEQEAKVLQRPWGPRQSRTWALLPSSAPQCSVCAASPQSISPSPPWRT